MILGLPETLLVFSLMVGVGLCVIFGAQLFRVQFSLGTVFVSVTVACVGLAMIAAMGPTVWSAIGWILMIVFPPANFIIVALLVITVLHARGEPQAVAIGRLIPLIGLAISDTFRVGGLLAALRFGPATSGLYLFVCVIAYATSLISGHVCRRAHRRLTELPAMEALQGSEHHSIGLPDSLQDTGGVR